MSRNIRKIGSAPAETGATKPKKAAPEKKAVTARPAKGYQKYSFDVAYAGASPVLRKNPSHTRVRIEEFGKAPDAKLSSRTESLLVAMRQQYGTKPFERGNLDAGVLKLLGRKGLLRHVEGDPALLTAKFALNAAR